MATNDLDRNNLRRQSPSPPSPSSSSRCSSLFPPPSKIPRLTPQALATEALGELEFRKQFLILNYFAGNELDKVTSAEEIRSFKDLPMAQFEEQLWERYGRTFVDEEDRVTNSDWDLKRTHVYHCHVSKEGSFRFKGPFLVKTRTHLHNVLDDDNILMVKFADTHDPHNAGYGKIAKKGIPVGLRLYRFFVFKDGGKEEKKKSPTSSSVKCYFVRTLSKASIDQNASYILSNKTICEARQLFMHAHTVPNVSNYMARFSLILSKTHKLEINLSSVNVEIIEDVCCLDESGNPVYRDGKPLVHTDGTGFISEDLASLCPKNLFKGQCINNENIEIFNNPDNVVEMEQIGSDTREPPLLIQFRMFYNGYAVKGTLLVNKKLAPSTIQIRESMIKVKPDPVSKHPTVNSLEIVRTSNPPKETFLSRYLIALLSHGGVPDKFFTDLLSKALREDRGNFSNKHAAFKVAKKYGNMDSDFTVARMIACGIPLDESFLQYRLSVLTKDETKSLKKGKLLLPDCFFLMGTTDPTGKLKSDEVCVVLDNDQVLGKVLVYRYPGQHFGDIHVLKATNIEELESFVGNAKNAIFFSQKGARSVADEIAGGDLDGDLYWVSRNGELLKHFTPSEPWVPKPSMGKVDESKMPRNLSDEQLEDELIELFLKTRFQPSYAKSDAADSWLAHMDRSLTLGDDKVAERNAIKKKLIKLNDINHEALDAPKKGVTIKVPRELRPKEFPHYMERKNSFKSNSILGKIYDQVKAYMEEDLSKKEIRKLPCFDDDVPENCWKSWKGNYDMYRAEMSDALSNNDSNVKNKAADKIITKYKKLLYGAKELEERTKKMDDIYNEALAIYNLSYDYAISKNDVARCSFAWKVAGSALFELYAKKNGERTFIFSPSVLNEMF